MVDKFMDLVKKADEGNRKWRVRYAIGETLCHFTKYLSLEVIRNDILPIYLEYLKDKEQEIRSISVSALPDLCGELNEEGEIVTAYLE